MRKTGLHYTLNDGFSWTAAHAAGLEGQPHAVAVHPDDAATVAAATGSGIYVSRDSGNRFQPLAENVQGLAAFFDLDGKHLWYSSYDGQARLSRILLEGGKPTAAKLPHLQKDAVAYIAQNPASRDEYAIATFGRNVYLSKDTGRSWAQIAERGSAK